MRDELIGSGSGAALPQAGAPSIQSAPAMVEQATGGDGVPALALAHDRSPAMAWPVAGADGEYQHAGQPAGRPVRDRTAAHHAEHADQPTHTLWAGRPRNAPRRKTPTCAGASKPQTCGASTGIARARRRHRVFNHHGDCTMSTHFRRRGATSVRPRVPEFRNGNDELRRLCA